MLELSTSLTVHQGITENFLLIIKDILFCRPIQARFEFELCIMLSSQTKDSPPQGSQLQRLVQHNKQ